MTFVLVGISAHPVWIGLLLSYFVGYSFHLTPIAGYCNFFPGTVGAQCEGPTNWAYHLICRGSRSCSSTPRSTSG